MKVLIFVLQFLDVRRHVLFFNELSDLFVLYLDLMLHV